MNWYSSSRTSSRVLLLAFGGLLLAGPAGAQLPKKQVFTPAPPSLQVREFSGDFAKWGASAALGDGGLVRDFRGSTTRKEAVTGQYEVIYGLGKSDVKPMILPKPLGAAGIFSIDFTNYLSHLRGSPTITKTFLVRVTLLDVDEAPLAVQPSSQFVTLTYHPPGLGTRFDSQMAVILKSVQCIETTSGPGSDEVRLRAVGAKPARSGLAKDLHELLHEGFDAGDAILPDVLLHTFVGPSFQPDLSILVGLAEDDDRTAPGLPTSGLGVPNSDPLFGLKKVMCEGDQVDDDCIGPPQKLPITAADWHKAVVKKEVVTKSLSFMGDGGHYVVVFELRKM